MADHVAVASPEKRIFMSLITRDISLADAVLDLLDNAINSAIILQKLSLDEASDFIELLDKEKTEDTPKVAITFSDNSFEMHDTSGGISLSDAENKVFRFGRPPHQEDEADSHDDDTLSVYGIGMKRAIFKIGDHVRINSRHRDSGFTMDLRVRAWEKLPQEIWTIPIEALPWEEGLQSGTSISISELFPDIARRISDGSFEGELIRKIARTYSYFLERIVSVEVNGKLVEPAHLSFGENLASDQFQIGSVSCSVLAGISVPEGKFFQADKAGWYVFCNGRAVAFADKTSLTGWGTFLPVFQPKHRPFLGLVFFTSSDPEDLPWTTTKAGLNQESAVWQHTLRVISSIGRQVTSFLDSRYSDDGSEISTTELADAAGKPTSAFTAPLQVNKHFNVIKQKRTTTSIQFVVKIDELSEVKSYIGDRSMSNTEVGRYVFDYFLNNIVRE